MPAVSEKIVPLPVVLVTGHVVDVPLDMLMPDPSQPRHDFDQAALADLAVDIEKRGVENPIRVRSDFVIKHGERRWRASRMAGKQTIPCLLADPAADENPALEWLLDQAGDNEQQKKLTAMDWARCLRRLVDDYGVPVKDIPDLLAKRGITMSRSYVSNLMRLDDLPEWAQKLITSGELTASDGKQMLMAKPYPKAMEQLKQLISDVEHRRQEGVTLREEMFRYDYENMEDLVHSAYRETAIELSYQYGDKHPLFDWAKDCKSCDKRQKIGNDHFCLDEICFEQKQAQAKAEPVTKGKSAEPTRAQKKKPTGPTVIKPDKVNEHGVVNLKGIGREKFQQLLGYGVRFETAVHCTGCEHNRLAIHPYRDGKSEPTCFNPPCFEQKQRNGNREDSVAQWLDKRLLPLVEAKLTNNYELQFQILVWMALDAPTQTDEENRVADRLRAENHRVRKHLVLRTPAAIFDSYAAAKLNAQAVAAAGIRAMMADRGNFYAFARYLGIKLTPEIASIDAEYLGLKRKAEILGLLEFAGWSAKPGVGIDIEKLDPTMAATSPDKLKADDLKSFCLNGLVIAAIGVPPDVQALYTNLDPVIDPDWDDEDDEEDPEWTEETDEENNNEDEQDGSI